MLTASNIVSKQPSVDTQQWWCIGPGIGRSTKALSVKISSASTLGKSRSREPAGSSSLRACLATALMHHSAFARAGLARSTTPFPPWTISSHVSDRSKARFDEHSRHHHLKIIRQLRSFGKILLRCHSSAPKHCLSPNVAPPQQRQQPHPLSNKQYEGRSENEQYEQQQMIHSP